MTDLLCFEFKFTQNKNHDHVSTNSVGMDDDKEEESGAETKGLTMVSEACKRLDKKFGSNSGTFPRYLPDCTACTAH